VTGPRATAAPPPPQLPHAPEPAAARHRNAATPAGPAHLAAEGVTAHYGAACALRDLWLAFPRHEVTAVIGPSGCGKSTLLRCLNRLHEAVPQGRVRGRVVLDGRDVYAAGVSAVAVRRRIGMVFQRPTPFPTLSVRDNVAAGLRGRRGPRLRRVDEDEIVERALSRAALWTEVRGRLRGSALALSVGQQQRLCIARALATEPAVLLLDEPTAALDPGNTQRVEELVYDLRGTTTVVMVTHNMQQAARVSDRTAFLLGGELIEVAPTGVLFTTPRDARTEAYITGRFG
jgi:phosphate transport system ATP-binding protein